MVENFADSVKKKNIAIKQRLVYFDRVAMNSHFEEEIMFKLRVDDSESSEVVLRAIGPTGEEVIRQGLKDARS